MAKMRVVIYLRGEDEGTLDDAEKQCGEYAERFGWQVLEVIRQKTETDGLSQLVMKVNKLRAQIILTDTSEMLSSDQGVRDNFMEAIERQQCIVHPINMPLRRATTDASGQAAGQQVPQGGSTQRWSTVIDGGRLREVRRQRGLSQEGLADLAQISITTMARLERQQRPSCRSWTLGRLAAALNEDPATFIAAR